MLYAKLPGSLIKLKSLRKLNNVLIEFWGHHSARTNDDTAALTDPLTG